jgi:hypothetical protein
VTDYAILGNTGLAFAGVVVMDAPEVTEALPHRHHSAGKHAWFDIALAISALAISVISLATAIHHGKVMEQLVATNAKQAQAAVWPYLALQATLERAEQSTFRMSLLNNGVGPAQVRTFEVLVDGVPVPNWRALRAACCAEVADVADTGLTASSAIGAVLPANKDRVVFALQRMPQNERLFDAFVGSLKRLEVRACYCSVFDECFAISTIASKREAVPSCPVAAVPYEVAIESRP